MNSQQAAVLRSAEGEEIPLRGVSARGRLRGLLFELEVEQAYENTGRENIEASFTFPVPHRAVLLGLELQIGERALQAVAVRHQAARERYEEAIEGGDSAALLEQAGDGLWSLSLGNLMAGERALIRYRYAELLDRKGDEVRLAVPTCIAPRYGDPAAHGLEPHQVPTASLLAEYPFTLAIDISGSIAAAALDSPSHRIEVAEAEDGKRVTLAAGAFLDRDFILVLRGPATAGAGLVAPDGEGHVALASLDPALPTAARAPLALKLLVDCSGSMAGSSMDCARHALLDILDRLGPGDQLSLTRFGSHVEHVVPPEPAPRGVLRGGWRRRRAGLDARPAAGGRLVAATPELLDWLRGEVAGMQADLGGTHLDEGLSAAFAIPVPEGTGRELLLITDAEVWSVAQMIELAERSGHRLFVVAVGAAPAEALARELGERTGGACEFVAPGEDAEAAILRMFKRMREPSRQVVRVEWPAEPLWQAPLPPAVFPGDTLHLLAGFATAPTGAVRVVIADMQGCEQQREIVLPAPTPHAMLPRLAAARRLPSLGEEEAAALAERYQLASRHTSFVVVQQRAADEKADKLPSLRAVPQMLAAGWGVSDPLARFPATGSLMMEALVADLSIMPSSAVRRRTVVQSVPAAFHYPGDMQASPFPFTGGEATPAEVLEALVARLAAGAGLPATWTGLAELGVPLEVIEWLVQVVAGMAAQPGEDDAVALFIALLARSPAGDALAADDRSALQGTVLGNRRLRELRAALSAALGGLEAASWQAVLAATSP